MNEQWTPIAKEDQSSQALAELGPDAIGIAAVSENARNLELAQLANVGRKSGNWVDTCAGGSVKYLWAEERLIKTISTDINFEVQ